MPYPHPLQLKSCLSATSDMPITVPATGEVAMNEICRSAEAKWPLSSRDLQMRRRCSPGTNMHYCAALLLAIFVVLLVILVGSSRPGPESADHERRARGQRDRELGRRGRLPGSRRGFCRRAPRRSPVRSRGRRRCPWARSACAVDPVDPLEALGRYAVAAVGETESSTWSSRRSAVSSTRPPDRVWRSAFSSRFARTSSMRSCPTAISGRRALIAARRKPWPRCSP